VSKEKVGVGGNLGSKVVRSKRYGKTTKIAGAFEQNGSRIKRFRKPE
jgi:hypothetical protein